MNLNPNSSQFEAAVLENSDAAYNLARWLVHNDQDAQDVVQEACVRAIRFHKSCRGEFRPWFLAIVRNTSLTWLRRGKGDSKVAGGSELADHVAADPLKFDPIAVAERATDVACIRAAVEQLPQILREALVLREMEGLSYKEIGKIAGVPLGTVMSRLARGRMQLQAILLRKEPPEDCK